jgi:hypothetical protein
VTASPGNDESDDHELFCPSAQPDLHRGVVVGVVGGTPREPRVVYLADPVPVTTELLDLARPVHPTEVFRMGAPCAGTGCRHYDGARCTLVRRVVAEIPAVASTPPPCRLRPRCRWWHEEGAAACTRCPLIVTEQPNPTPAMAHAARPDRNGDPPRPSGS